MPVSQILHVFRTDCATTTTHRTEHSPLSSGVERRRRGGNLSFSFFFIPFFLKANAVQNYFTVGPGLFVQSCQFPYLNVGWGFFPSYSSLNEGDSCFFYVSLLKEGCEGKIIFQIPQELTQNVWTKSSFQRSDCSALWLGESFKRLIKSQMSS